LTHPQELEVSTVRRVMRRQQATSVTEMPEITAKNIKNHAETMEKKVGISELFMRDMLG
jgi:hypothetical protein